MRCTTDIKIRLGKSHHQRRNNTCGITEHFYGEENNFNEDFEFLPIVKLRNPPRTIMKRRERLEESELYWHEDLVTYVAYGMNKKIEIERTKQNMKKREKSKEIRTKSD